MEKQIIDEDQGLIRVTTIHEDGRKHTMWYPSMEVYEAEKKVSEEFNHNFWMAMLWGPKK